MRRDVETNVRLTTIGRTNLVNCESVLDRCFKGDIVPENMFSLDSISMLFII